MSKTVSRKLVLKLGNFYKTGTFLGKLRSIDLYFNPGIYLHPDKSDTFWTPTKYELDRRSLR